MFKSKTARLILISIVLLLLVAAGAWIAGAVPSRLITHYSWQSLAQEAYTMDDCAACHDAAHFHTCDTCHDDHGAVEMTGVQFYAVIALTGDVPEPGFVLIDDVLPYREQPHTHVPLLDFLAEQEVTDFESVTMTSRDEGFITIERENLTSGALLMPYVDGVRFADENLHVSTWIKGITRIIVVGEKKPLTVDGRATSIGRLLLGPTRSVTVEQTDVMLKSGEDGEVRTAKTAARIEGPAVVDVVADPDFDVLVMRDGSGQEHALAADEAQGAVLYPDRGGVTLVLPGRGRSQWVADVVEVVTE